MYNVMYDMLLSLSLLSDYFRLEILLVTHGEDCRDLAECCKLMVALTVEGQKHALGKSG